MLLRLLVMLLWFFFRRAYRQSTKQESNHQIHTKKNIIHKFIICTIKKKFVVFYRLFSSFFFFSNILQTPENCSGGGDCMPMIISWEGAAEIQSGDILIVEIDDTLLLPADMNPSTIKSIDTING